MHGWTVVVRLDSKASTSQGEVRRRVEDASQKRGGTVSESDVDLLISIPDRESADVVAREVKRFQGVLDAYLKPPVALP